MTEPNEFGDRWCCGECKRLAEAAADEVLVNLSHDHRCPGCGTPISPQYTRCIDCERLPGWHAGREVGNVAS